MTVMIFRNKRTVQAAVVLAGMLLLSVMAADSRTVSSFWKAATYFSDEWVMNFWNSEMDSIDEDFMKIRADGFNSIILVIPWREFQPETDPVVYNDDVFHKLSWVMDKADQHGLDVIVRIGYAHDFYDVGDDSQIWQRYYDYFSDVRIQTAWKDYLKKLDDLLTKHKRYLGAFITWEDWWETVTYAQTLGGRCQESILAAQQLGYQEYMYAAYSVKELRQLFEDDAVKGKADIYIPSVETKAFVTFYDFYDTLLNRLLADSQQVMPDLSMEVRSDQDLVYDEAHHPGYYSHKNTFSCQNSSFVTTVYGIPMGFENQGEKVTAEQALEKTEYMLDEIHKVTHHKDLFIDQFLFYDNTPKFPNNAQLYTEEVNGYLERAAKLLYDQTIGYGIWTYRDYHSNMLYNPQFALGKEGWTITGSAKITDNGSKKLKLEKGSCVSQTVSSARINYSCGQITVAFDAELADDKSARLRIKVGDTEVQRDITASGRITEIMQEPGSWDLSIQTDTDLSIDNVKLYSHTQKGLIYDSSGREQECLEGMRRMNACIDAYQVSDQKGHEKP